MSETRTDVIVSQPGTADRRVYIDFIKILAILMVVFNHTGTRGFLLFTQSRESALYWFYLFNTVLIKMAVPLFFMCSGALLLGKKESYGKVIRKRFLRFFVILVVASILMYVYNRVGAGKKLSVYGFFKSFYSKSITTPYWYLYRYLAYILMLPLLRKIADGMTKVDFRWIVIIFVIMRAVPVFEFLVWQGKVELYSTFYLFLELDYVAYPLIGYYIDKSELPEKSGKTVLLLMLLGLAAIGIGCGMTNYRCTLLNAWKSSNCQRLLDNLIVGPAAAVFYACKVWFVRHKPGPRAAKVITTLGGLTFGIYLLEEFVRSETKGIFDFLKPFFHSLPACWIWVLCVCILCGSAAFILKKIPGVKKYL